MENSTNLGADYYKEELERAIRDLHAARNEIEYLNKENNDLIQEVGQLRKDLDRLEHEDEVVITTKHPIKNIEVYFS